MFILYKESVHNGNIVGYFTDYQILLGSIKVTYSGIKEVSFRETLFRVEVLSGINVIATLCLSHYLYLM